MCFVSVRVCECARLRERKRDRNANFPTKLHESKGFLIASSFLSFFFFLFSCFSFVKVSNTMVIMSASSWQAGHADIKMIIR